VNGAITQLRLASAPFHIRASFEQLVVRRAPRFLSPHIDFAISAVAKRLVDTIWHAESLAVHLLTAVMERRERRYTCPVVQKGQGKGVHHVDWNREHGESVTNALEGRAKLHNRIFKATGNLLVEKKRPLGPNARTRGSSWRLCSELGR
jgi:hypothetical protein